ncbi:putative ribosome biogenesis GTPase RsgA [Spirochaetia bacterium]|nr:putative ribosome biogenesis GTPase RsgA [Spirochaetia bacterium]
MFDLQEYGFTQAELSLDAAGISTDLTGGDIIPGRVTEIRRDLYKVVCQYGEVPAVLKGSFYHAAEAREDFPAVGDFVVIKYNGNGNSGITEVLSRRSKFSRTDFSGHQAEYVKHIQEQVVAANFDYVFIMSSLNYDFNLARIARYLTATRRSGGLPVVVLTKADLCEDFSGQIAAIREMAEDVPVIALSSKTGYGIDELRPFLKPAKTIVFLGSSGVGKSSLLNSLAGETVMDVKAIREDDSKGRHTTSHRQLFKLASGALVIDTPGMRELGLWDAGEAVSIAFGSVEELISRCRFSNCTHKNEPGCAVLAALNEGSLSPVQWKNYLAQKRETLFVENRSEYFKSKREFHKSIAKKVRNKRDEGFNGE